MNKGYLKTYEKVACFGCEACAQICPKSAISMSEDAEGFRYPVINKKICIECDLCSKVCPVENIPMPFLNKKYVFGGYISDANIRDRSTSGGAFSAIVETWCEEDYVIFGAASNELEVYHTYIIDKKEIDIFRKSKYSQSKVGMSYENVKKFLLEGKKVVFSGTPCQIAGLRAFLGDTEQERLLLIDVVCEGVPSPMYIRKYNEWCLKKYNSQIKNLDYRFKNGKKWDFEVMRTELMNGKKIKIDRWFNPFWSIWLDHLMSRPSCYACPFTSVSRVADITLGDLWGVHLYCPELYGKNSGASLVVANSEKGINAIKHAQTVMYGHELDFDTAIKYQKPMRECISENSNRENFISDLKSNMEYVQINKKWAKKPTLKLLWQKYIYGNRQKVLLWNIKSRKNRFKSRKKIEV